MTSAHATPATPRIYGAVPLAALAAAVAIWLLMPPQEVLQLMAEGGPLETGTAVLYGVGIAVLCVARKRLRDAWAFAALVLFMSLLMARELDLHLSLTGTSVLRVSYYLRGEFTAAKALGLLAIAAFLFTLGYFARTAWRRGWWRAPLQAWRDPLTAPALAFIASIVVAKVLDRTVSIATEDFGIPVPMSVAALVVSCEEMLELGLPLLVMLAVLRAPQPASGQARA